MADKGKSLAIILGRGPKGSMDDESEEETTSMAEDGQQAAVDFNRALFEKDATGAFDAFRAMMEAAMEMRDEE